MTENRPTNEAMARPSLFQRVERYYADCLAQIGGTGKEFQHWWTATRAELVATESYGADPAFLLHVLICTKLRGSRRYAEQNPAIQELSKRHSAQVAGALKLILDRGLPWLERVFVGDEKRAHEFLADVARVQALLVGGAITTPAWEVTARASGDTNRLRRNALTACILCMDEALKGIPNRTMAAVVLLEKFSLFRTRSVGGIARAKFLEQRIRRNKAKAVDRLGPIGNPVWHLRETFDRLKEFLDEPWARANFG